jgi:hypothetical protein
VSRPTNRRNFIKRAVAVTGTTWIGFSSPAILNAFEVHGGLSVSNLEHLKDQLAARQTTGLLVRRHNRTVYEWYAPGWGPERRHYTASMAKSLVGGIEYDAFYVRRLDLEFSS